MHHVLVLVLVPDSTRRVLHNDQNQFSYTTRLQTTVSLQTTTDLFLNLCRTLSLLGANQQQQQFSALSWRSCMPAFHVCDFVETGERASEQVRVHRQGEDTMMKRWRRALLYACTFQCYKQQRLQIQINSGTFFVRSRRDITKKQKLLRLEPAETSST